ncbi:enoyl-CoA hydratase/isomerase family protein (plasmid) [Peteryoungia desertarenae]|uniref:Enoyl-CoA hydratase/isomerase family protein n=1 Tax=Peteryoungia desertarenae TaxID=1813451 RepID=A0ABX6QT64_9HYPH|nr:enoyl-CoA hydratase/isomerase family protein [Peteryoungia desertarenae]QLF71846.1 enoyl-CoA hydratase/isomerase family protein [Peteryoungia desertarenae]
MSAVHLKITDGIAEVRLDNPAKLNAFTIEMLEQFSDHLALLDRIADIRCVIVTAQGDRAFCAGADINAWGDLTPAEFARHWVRDGHRIFDRLARLSKPVIAAMSGHAFGGGLELAAACDIRVMAPSATIALPEAHVGIVPGWSGTQRLARLLPEPILKEMTLFGRRITAERAQAFGFIAEVSATPEETAQVIARSVLSLSPRAVEVAKFMIHAGRGEDRDAMIEALGSAAIAASTDRDEGVAAFRAKRKPAFSGE